MPAYRFSWDHFDDRTMQELARALGHRGSPAEARTFVAARVARPNDAFVKDTKDVLARTWLPQHEGIARSVVRDLFELRIGPRGAPPEGAQACAAYVDRCHNTSRLRELLCGRLISYGDSGRESDATGDDGFIPAFGVLVPGKQAAPTRKPHAHQEAAWAKLDAHLAKAGPTGAFKGVLVMPTGSGKTFTASTWIGYLLWHEYLHLHLMRRDHQGEFKTLEHSWPDHVACDGEMDSLNQKFGVQYW